MRGIGRAHGAVTIVNALPTNVGCAVGVSLPVEAELELRRTPPSTTPTFEITSGSDTPLSRASLLAGLRRFADGADYSVSLKVRSRIPPARGLKSSSAVSGAILRAVGDALGASAAAAEIAALSADLTQEIRLSATGAFDDALAALVPEIVVTDNRARALMRSERPDPSWKVALWIPHQAHTPSVDWAGAFVRESGSGRAAVDAALKGDYLQALARNTELVEQVMGYDYRGLREELRRQGALGSGVSGMGPTLAAFVPEARRSSVVRAMPNGPNEVLAVELCANDPSLVDGRG